MSVQSIIRWFLPKEEHFYDMIEELGALGHEAAVTLEKFRERPSKEVQEAVQIIEHRADDVVRRMEDSLARTFVTPLDREDLHRLTNELDDIVDLANLTARAFALYNIDRPTPTMIKLMEQLVACTALLKEAVPALRAHNFDSIRELGRRVRMLEKDADTTYRAEISNLFREAHIDFRDLLKQKEALDDLENAVDHCDNVADLLTNMAVKNG